MKRSVGSLGMLGLGAGWMYLFDPNLGRTRRARLKDKGVHAAHMARRAVDKNVRYWGNRLNGLAMEIWRARQPIRNVADDIIVARVRSQLGRLVEHPHQVEILSHEGRITLSGRIAARELGRLLVAVHNVRGVTAVENRLQVQGATRGEQAIAGIKWLAGLLTEPSQTSH